MKLCYKLYEVNKSQVFHRFSFSIYKQKQQVNADQKKEPEGMIKALRNNIPSESES